MNRMSRMKRRLAAAGVLVLAGLALSACSGGNDSATTSVPQPAIRASTATRSDGPVSPATVSPATTAAAASAATQLTSNRVGGKPAFTPPPDSAIPDGPFGDVVRQGRDIFVDTQQHAKAYVGNQLNCVNCHLDAGRLRDSAPMWGAWGMYPQYRKKNLQVNTFGERLQGCFEFSMNGTAPALDSKEMIALQTYVYWMATGAPTGVALDGAGFAKDNFKSPQPPDYARGRHVFETNCALCHGVDGQGQRAAGRTVFPPLWGPQSFNWGAGMHQLDNAAAFIKHNMPLGRGGMLDDQAAWDVAYYMNAHERPQDPRFNGDVAQTRKAYHDSPMSLYGVRVNGHLLGSEPATQ